MLLILTHADHIITKKVVSMPFFVFFYIYINLLSHLHRNCTRLFYDMKMTLPCWRFGLSPSVCHTANRVVRVYLRLPFWKIAPVNFSNKEMDDSVTITFLTMARSLCFLFASFKFKLLFFFTCCDSRKIHSCFSTCS